MLRVAQALMWCQQLLTELMDETPPSLHFKEPPHTHIYSIHYITIDTAFALQCKVLSDHAQTQCLSEIVIMYSACEKSLFGVTRWTFASLFTITLNKHNILVKRFVKCCKKVCDVLFICLFGCGLAPILYADLWEWLPQSVATIKLGTAGIIMITTVK